MPKILPQIGHIECGQSVFCRIGVKTMPISDRPLVTKLQRRSIKAFGLEAEFRIGYKRVTHQNMRENLLCEWDLNKAYTKGRRRASSYKADATLRRQELTRTLQQGRRNGHKGPAGMACGLAMVPEEGPAWRP